MDKTILIIEDESPISNALSQILSPHGYKIETCFDGVSGLSKAIEIRPDLVLLDIILPGIDGIEVLEKIRMEENWGKEAQVLILSNLTLKEKQDRAKELGVIDYVIKSNVSINALASKIQSFLV